MKLKVSPTKYGPPTLRDLVRRTSEPAVTEMLEIDVLFDVSGSRGVSNGAPGCNAMVAVPVTVLGEPAVIFPGMFPTTSVAPAAIGPAMSQVTVPALSEQLPGSAPLCVKPVGSGNCTRSDVAASGPALLTDTE